MANDSSVRDLLHSAMHRIPSVPAHTEWPAGHQGTARHASGNPVARNHSAANPPRVLVAWQRRIAVFFG